jgi:uncharacterized membrane protein
MTSPRNKIIELIDQGAIPPNNIDDALTVLNIVPDGKAWRTFIDHLLLWLGGLALACAGVFFIAYNWNDIGRFAKFGMVEAFIVLAIVAYWKLGAHAVAGKVSLLLATIFLGVLLALYGQTYQTGADPWQLFFNWALLMLPWAFIGRFPAIWVLWVVLINLTIVLYHQAFRGAFWLMIDSSTDMLWLVFFCNALALATWELLGNIWHWLAERWAIRLLAIGAGVPVTWLALHAIFDQEETGILPAVVWALFLAALYLVYRKMKHDLFMLAGGCLSGIVIVVSFMAKHMLDDFDEGAFLVLALVVIGLGAGAAVWLRNIHREWQS